MRQNLSPLAAQGGASAEGMRERSPTSRQVDEEEFAVAKKDVSGVEKKITSGFLVMYIALIRAVLALDNHDWGKEGFWTEARVGDWGASDPGHWCEHDRPEKFMREKWNALSDLSFLGVSLWMLRCAVVDKATREWHGRDVAVVRTLGSDGQMLTEDDSLSLRNHPWRSVLFAILNAFHFFGTFTNHASRLQFGHVCDVAGMFGILGVLSLHGLALRSELLHGIETSNMKFTVLIGFFMVGAWSVARGLLYNHWATEPIELGGFVVSLLPLLGAGFSISRRTGPTKAIAGLKQRLAVDGDEGWKQLKASVALLAVGAISQTVDQPRHGEVPLWKWAVGKHQEVFGPCFSAEAVAPMHAVWHVTTAVAMLLIYQTFRWLHSVRGEEGTAFLSE